MAVCPENASIGDIFERYESMRTANVDALLDMHRHGFPFQYGQVPWRQKLGFVRTAVLVKLSELAPSIFSKPFTRRLPSTEPYGEIWKDSQASTHRLQSILVVFVAVLLGTMQLV